MKNLFFSLILGLTLFFVVPAVAAPNIGFENGGLAQKIGGSAGYDTSAGETGLSTTIGKIIRAMLSLSGTLFLALTVYGGVLWMLARGDEGEIEKGKEIIKSALIGLAITMSAYAITTFVVGKITSSTGADQVGGSPQAGAQAPSCENSGGRCYPAGTPPTAKQPLVPGACANQTDVCLKDNDNPKT